jgi:hypothetical protein
MIRFLRVLVITIILAAVAGYIVTYSMSARIVDRVRMDLLDTLVASFSPGKDDQYGFKVNLHFWPPTAEITNLYVKANALQVDGDIFNNCDVHIDKIVVDLYPLLKDKQLKILKVEGRKFSGLLTLDRLAKRLERTGGPMSGLSIENYNGKARIRGRFGTVSIATMTVDGTWKIDSRKVITLTNRSYYNPDSNVPSGAIQILEKNISFDIRIHILNEEVAPEKVSFSSAGLQVGLSG